MSQLVLKPKNLPDNINDLRKFILVGKEQLKSFQAKVNAVTKLGLSKAVRDQALEDSQRMATALLYAEAKMGEIIALIPNKKASSGGGTRSLPDGITKKQSHFAQKLHENRHLIEETIAEAQQNEDIPTRTEVLRKAKEIDKNTRLKNDRVKAISDLDIRKGDFKKVLSDVKDIDAIITDPPYPKEYIQCFSDLSKFAMEHLKDKGFLAAYSGQYNLPEVINRLSEHLTYVWTFCLYHVGKKQLVNGVNIMCGWKPVLIFSKGCKKMRFSAYDVLISEAREKESHEWQQSETGVSGLIEILSKPGDVIVDPFAGSGTFLKVANEMGRRGIGAEIN